MSYHENVIPVDLPAVSLAKMKKSKSLRPWTIIDATGQTTVLELDKYAIMRRVHISVRDLRILDRDSSYPCTILGRERAIVLHLEPIKMIITAEEVYLWDPKEIDAVLPLDELRKRLSVENKAGCGQGDGEEILDAQSDADDEDEYPFEFRALEVALVVIYSLLDKRTRELEVSVYPALDELTSKISKLILERIRQMKRITTSLTAQVQKVRDELERLMENDDDLAELCLSGKLARTTSQLSGEPISNPTPRTIGRKFSRAKRVSFGTGRGDEVDVEELEMLIEPYFFRINTVMMKLSSLQEYIDDSEDYINIKLDSVRNQLIKFDVILSSASICVSVYSLVAGILGMNIPNSWNNHRYMFKWVVSVTGTLCGILFVIIMLYARYQRLVGF